MIELKQEYPYIDTNKKERFDLVKIYAEDEKGNQYFIKQNETSKLYASAVDSYPSKYNYTATDKIIKVRGLRYGNQNR